MNPRASLLRWTGRIEGLSFLLLMGIAMPLKHLWGQPLAVKILGWIHGLLFVAFCVVLLAAMRRHRWSLGRGALLFGAALIPFGPFLVDGRIRSWESNPPPGGS
jgi:integral membrane protein